MIKKTYESESVEFVIPKSFVKIHDDFIQVSKSEAFDSLSFVIGKRRRKSDLISY